MNWHYYGELAKGLGVLIAWGLLLFWLGKGIARNGKERYEAEEARREREKRTHYRYLWLRLCMLDYSTDSVAKAEIDEILNAKTAEQFDALVDKHVNTILTRIEVKKSLG